MFYVPAAIRPIMFTDSPHAAPCVAAGGMGAVSQSSTTMRTILSRRVVTLVVAALATATGCAGRPSLLPNGDPALRKTSPQFAADAATRHPYKAAAPRGGEAVARAEADYMFKHLNLVNLSPEDWKDVEIWVNQNYVVFV